MRFIRPIQRSMAEREWPFVEEKKMTAIEMPAVGPVRPVVRNLLGESGSGLLAMCLVSETTRCVSAIVCCLPSNQHASSVLLESTTPCRWFHPHMCTDTKLKHDLSCTRRHTWDHRASRAAGSWNAEPQQICRDIYYVIPLRVTNHVNISSY